MEHFNDYGRGFGDLLRLIREYSPRRIPSGQAGDRRAAVGIILRETGKGPWGAGGGNLPGEVLYIRRTVNGADPWSGQMAFPGGHVDGGDASTVMAAVREVQEEVGLDLVENDHMIGALDDVRALARGGPLPLVITPVVFALRDPNAVLKLRSAEVAAGYWIRLSYLMDRGNLSSETFYHRQGLPVDFPCWKVEGGHPIWGLTYQMTVNLLDVLSGGPSPSLSPCPR